MKNGFDTGYLRTALYSLYCADVPLKETAHFRGTVLLGPHTELTGDEVLPNLPHFHLVSE